MLKLILLLNPVYVTLFWAIVLNTNHSKHNIPKVFLGKFMIVGFILYISHFLYYYPLPSVYIYVDSIYQYCSLLVYPLYYIYVRLLTIDLSFAWKQHAKYLLLPTCMFILYSAGILLFMNKESHIDFLYRVLPHHLPVEGSFLYQKIVYTCCRGIFVVQAFLYLYAAFRLIARNKARVQNYYSNQCDDSLQKINLLTLTLAMSIVAGIILDIMGKESFLQNEYALIAPSVIFTIMLFAIGWLGNLQRAVLTDEQESITQNEIADELNVSQLKPTVLHLFEEEKIYLNKDLTLWDVARRAATNRTYISYVINNEFGLNFCTFVNNYRVEYAKILMQQSKELDNDEIAELSGFGSVDSLNRSFLSKEQITFRKYRNTESLKNLTS